LESSVTTAKTTSKESTTKPADSSDLGQTGISKP
jgi:hypothetical protein